MTTKLITSFILTATLLAAISLHAAAQDTTKIAFSSNRDGNSEIYTMNPDGTNQTRLTNNEARDAFPYWSPDGKKILFQSAKPGDSPPQLYTMNPDGTDKKQLTNCTHGHKSASWSPDGKTIAFFDNRDGSSNIYTMDAQGGEETQITNVPDHSFLSPTWSPDSKQIAAEGGDPNKMITVEWGEARLFQIYVITVDQSPPPRQVTDTVAYNGYPAWSPNGDTIAFDANPGDSADIMTVDLANKKITNITNQETQSEFAAWSHDAKKIAFTANRDGNVEIYTMNADGTNQTRLTNTEAGESAPAWSPPLK